MCVPDSIQPGFFILRTYVLWNKNIVVLGAMLSAFFVSPMPSPHHKLLLHLSQAVVVAFGSILFSAKTTAPCTRSNIPCVLCYHFHLLLPLS
jgi:hypothetical protein